MSRKCGYCPKPIVFRGIGRPPEFCGEPHRRAAPRFRRKYGKVIARTVHLLRGSGGPEQEGDAVIAAIIAKEAPV